MIHIREATNADIDTLREIGCETYREHFSTLWSPAGLQGFLDPDFSQRAGPVTRLTRTPALADGCRRTR